MGALRSELGQSSPSGATIVPSLDAAELQARRELSVLEDLHSARQGAPLAVGPIIGYAEDLAGQGKAQRGLDMMEVALSFPESFPKEDLDVLRLARAAMHAVTVPTPAAIVEDLKRLFEDEGALEDHRTEALMRIAEITAGARGYSAAAADLAPRQIEGAKRFYETPSVVLARATYLVLAGAYSSALHDTETLLQKPLGLTTRQLMQGCIQHAWVLTQLGRFADSSKFIHDGVHTAYGVPNAMKYIDAWNKVGAKGVSMREALSETSFTTDENADENEWVQSFFRAWTAFSENNMGRALELFGALPAGLAVEPTLNGTLDELILLGKAHTLLELGNYEAAYDAFHRLSASIPDRPEGGRLQIIGAALRYGVLSAKLNSVSAFEEVSAARRCAQVSYGLSSPLVPRFMDIEAELLLANGCPAEARALHTVALELIDRDEAGAEEVKLSHELGLHLVDAHEHKNEEARSGLSSLIHRMEKELGWHHEKTVIARYALTSLSDPSDQTGTDQAAFEELYEDLARTFGAGHLLSLKARYGLARRISLKGQATEALALYKAIEAQLPRLPQNLNFKTSVERRIGDSHRDLKQYEAAHAAYSSALESLKASIGPSSHRELEIQLDIHECLLKRGLCRQAMTFFSTTASMLRDTKSETTMEYFRAVHGYASCLELLRNHAGAAHNYGHLVRLLDGGQLTEVLKHRAQVYAGAAWNNELAKNFGAAASLYENALAVMRESHNVDTRQIADLEHRLACSRARLAA